MLLAEVHGQAVEEEIGRAGRVRRRRCRTGCAGHRQHHPRAWPGGMRNVRPASRPGKSPGPDRHQWARVVWPLSAAVAGHRCPGWPRMRAGPAGDRRGPDGIRRAVRPRPCRAASPRHRTLPLGSWPGPRPGLVRPAAPGPGSAPPRARGTRPRRPGPRVLAPGRPSVPVRPPPSRLVAARRRPDAMPAGQHRRMDRSPRPVPGVPPAGRLRRPPGRSRSAPADGRSAPWRRA